MVSLFLCWKNSEDTQHALRNHVATWCMATWTNRQNSRASMDARGHGYVKHMLDAIYWRQIPIAGMWKEAFLP